jgi:hypothetical protein
MPIFDFKDERKGITISIVGKRGSGKSYLLTKQILLHKDLLREKYDDIHLIHPNFLYDEKYHDINFTSVNTTFTEELVANICQEVREKYEEDNDYRACLIMDDVIGSMEFGKHKKTPLDECFYNSRHYGLSLIILSQRIYGLPKSIRTQMDYIILFPTRNGSERGDLYKEFGIEDKNEWEKLLKYVFTKRDEEDRPFLIIDANYEIYYRKFNRLDF